MAYRSERSKSAVRKSRRSRSLILAAVFGAILLSLLFVGVHYSGDSDAEKLNSANSSEGVHTDLNTEAKELTPASQTQGSKSQGEEPEDSEAAGTAALEETEEQAVPGLSISGAVLDDAGQLLSGATVVALPVDSPGHEAGGFQSPATQHTELTDNLGGFEFEDLVDGVYELTAMKGEDYYPATSKVRAGVENAELILQSFRSVRVYGQITDETGAPLDEVKVRSLGERSDVMSGPNGTYEILTGPARAGLAPVLNFEREGFQEARRRVEAALDPANTDVQLDVRMEPESTEPKVALSGQVLEPVGGAVAGVTVRLSSFKTQEDFSARTNQSGAFSFPEVEVGEGYRLKVMPSDEYEAYESDFFTLGPEDDYREITLDFAEYSDLSGTVTDLDGRPLGGFTLWLRGEGTNAQSPIRVQTDGSGGFQLEKLRAGEVRLESRSEPLLRATDIVLEPGGHRHVRIPLDWGNDWLLGRVVNSEGVPVSGARVVVSWEEAFWDLESQSRRNVRSDLEGYFTVSNLGARDYTLTVEAPGHQRTQIRHQLGGATEELVVHLPTTGAPGGTANGGR